MAKTVITLEDISVCYRAPVERISTFKEYAIRRLQKRVSFKEFWALRTINLQIYQGEMIGIIGHNGAGKSTLLKVISRVLAPTNGRIRINGKVSPLLELGAGFHPELTGRENIFLNGTLLGHSRKEITEKLDAILEFAEIGSFIEAPLRTFSSGMVARLGFAVATVWKPEILVLDEVLAVGDDPFRRKCQLRMEEFRAGGVTTLLVTHDLETIKSICNRVVWLEKGSIKEVGQADNIVGEYRRVF